MEAQAQRTQQLALAVVAEHLLLEVQEVMDPVELAPRVELSSEAMALQAVGLRDLVAAQETAALPEADVPAVAAEDTAAVAVQDLSAAVAAQVAAMVRMVPVRQVLPAESEGIMVLLAQQVSAPEDLKAQVVAAAGTWC